MMSPRSFLLGAALGLGALASACAHGSAARSNGQYGSTTLTSSGGDLDDAQVAQVARAALTAAAEESKMAASHATTPRVRDFATSALADYQSLVDHAQSLIARDRITPQTSPTSQQLTDDSHDAERELYSRQGADFDRAYVKRMIALQQRTLDLIDLTLIPSAKRGDLRSELERARPIVQRQLDAAKQLDGWLITVP